MAIATKSREASRVSVVLDDALVREAAELTGITTKRALLEEGLRMLVRIRKQERIRELFGTVDWQGDLAAMREGRVCHGDR
jgi:Arc/MetJ family transcription regulator